ncbi:hypothetical protein OFC13_28195, partial [Escherichia coli]|nr:hypothetical protein [Escherichia coli]
KARAVKKAANSHAPKIAQANVVIQNIAVENSARDPASRSPTWAASARRSRTLSITIAATREERIIQIFSCFVAGDNR